MRVGGGVLEGDVYAYMCVVIVSLLFKCFLSALCISSSSLMLFHRLATGGGVDKGRIRHSESMDGMRERETRKGRGVA